MAATAFTRVRTADGAIVCERCEKPETAFGRARGLLGREGLEPGTGMLIDRAGSVHMFFMRFAIDVVFLDRDRKVVGSGTASVRGVSPARGAPLPRSSCRLGRRPRPESKRETYSSFRTSRAEEAPTVSSKSFTS